MEDRFKDMQTTETFRGVLDMIVTTQHEREMIIKSIVTKYSNTQARGFAAEFVNFLQSCWTKYPAQKVDSDVTCSNCERCDINLDSVWTNCPLLEVFEAAEGSRT